MLRTLIAIAASVSLVGLGLRLEEIRQRGEGESICQSALR